ncbi:MAG: hypothetical protein U9N42_08995 [Campylobacterota bacterium]|nr:hypothetical protein [Campylobacterota bacterium]
MIKSIKLFLVIQLLILTLLLFSKEFYINFNVAYFSAFLVIVASFFSHYRAVNKKVATHNEEYENSPDEIDKIDDPYDLYSENEPVDVENADFKQIVKDEKAKIKTFSFETLKSGAGGGFSFFRLGAYALLIVGFMALKNNHILEIMPYLIGLSVGILSAIGITKVSYR